MMKQGVSCTKNYHKQKLSEFILIIGRGIVVLRNLFKLIVLIVKEIFSGCPFPRKFKVSDKLFS
jgi:hypothetical protein